jgi:hypothetical protein
VGGDRYDEQPTDKWIYVSRPRIVGSCVEWCCPHCG